MPKNGQCMVVRGLTELMMASHILAKGSKISNIWCRTLHWYASGIYQVHEWCDAHHVLRQRLAAIEETSYARLQYLAHMSQLWRDMGVEWK
jgi:muconolactone delta-isomerase